MVPYSPFYVTQASSTSPFFPLFFLHLFILPSLLYLLLFFPISSSSPILPFLSHLPPLLSLLSLSFSPLPTFLLSFSPLLSASLTLPSPHTSSSHLSFLFSPFYQAPISPFKFPLPFSIPSSPLPSFLVVYSSSSSFLCSSPFS